MKSLLMKDIYQMKIIFLPLFAYGVLMAVICAVMAGSKGTVAAAAGPSLALIAAYMPLLMILDDHRTGYEKLLGTMPISRKDMVKARYLLTLVLGTVLGLIFMVIVGVGAGIGGAPMKDVVKGSFMLMSVEYIYPAVCLPVVYGFGFRKVGAVAAAVLISMGMLYGALLAMSDKDVTLTVVQSMVILAAVLVLTGISYVISVKLFEKRDI